MIKYAIVTDLNMDQVKLIKKNGWSLFTETDCEGTSWIKGMHYINAVNFLVFSKKVKKDRIKSAKALKKIAKFDNDFNDLVNNTLYPIRDVCYHFLVKAPAGYTIKNIMTNAGFDAAVEKAHLRYSPLEFEYFPDEKANEMHNLVNEYNTRVKAETELAVKCLNKKGFIVVSEKFAAIRQ